MTCTDIFLGLIAILFPPIAVWVKRGICTADSLINITLCVLGYLPGLLHAWYIIASYPERDYEALPQGDAEGGHRVTYFYVDRRPVVGGEGGYGATDESLGWGPTTAVGGNPNDGPSAPGAGVPPSYDQAVKGDHKVQT